MNSAPVLRPDEAIATLGADAVLRAAWHAAWRAGDLSYHLSDIQIEARALVLGPHRKPVWLTNRRFGKSRTACTVADEFALAYPGVWIPYAAGTGVQVERFVHPHMRELANQAPPDLAPDELGGEWKFPPLQWYDAKGNPVATKLDGGRELARFRGRKNEEALRSSTIVPVGCEDRKKADRLRGPGTVIGIVDEAGQNAELDYVVGDVIGPMLWEARSRWGEHACKTLLTCGTPPEEPDHAYARMITEAEARGALLHADVYDCDHLDDRDIAEAIEDAGGEHTARWRREGLALVEPDPEWVVLPEFSEHAELVVEERERPEHALLHVIGDAGFEDLDVLALGYYDFRADLDVIEDEVVAQRSRSDLVDAMVAAKERELWARAGKLPKVHRRRIDAAPRVRADMSREEFQAIDDEDAVRHWNAVSKSGGEGKGSFRAAANAARVRLSRGRVRVHPRCRTIIAHAKAARWSRSNARELERVKDEKGRTLHHYDGCAALVYFLRDLDRTTNPWPALAPGVTQETHYIAPELRPEAKRHRLLAAFRRPRR